MGREKGVSEDQLRALGDYENSSRFTERELVILRYADAITATPPEVPDDLYGSLSRFYDEAQIVELTSAFAWENYRARFDHALKMEAEGFSEGSFCPLPK